jgi:hypothetical protein
MSFVSEAFAPPGWALFWAVFFVIMTGQKVKDKWSARSRATALKRVRQLENKLAFMRRLIDNPSELLAKGIFEIELAILIGTLTVIYVLNDPTKSPELRALFASEYGKSHEQVIADGIVFSSDFCALMVWVFMLRRMGFYRQLALFTKFEASTMGVIAKLKTIIEK